jgi:hypothetical protein
VVKKQQQQKLKKGERERDIIRLFFFESRNELRHGGGK